MASSCSRVSEFVAAVNRTITGISGTESECTSTECERQRNGTATVGRAVHTVYGSGPSRGRPKASRDIQVETGRLSTRTILVDDAEVRSPEQRSASSGPHLVPTLPLDGVLHVGTFLLHKTEVGPESCSSALVPEYFASRVAAGCPHVGICHCCQVYTRQTSKMADVPMSDQKAPPQALNIFASPCILAAARKRGGLQ